MATKDIGQRVLDRRLELGYYRQSEAAQAAGVSSTTWGLLEAKDQVPKTLRVRQQIARALQWPPDALEQLEQGHRPAPKPTDAEQLAQTLEHTIEEMAKARAEDRRWYAEQIAGLRQALDDVRREVQARRQ